MRCASEGCDPDELLAFRFGEEWSEICFDVAMARGRAGARQWWALVGVGLAVACQQETFDTSESASVAVNTATQPDCATDTKNWPMSGQNICNNRLGVGSENINPKTVATLSPKWVFATRYIQQEDVRLRGAVAPLQLSRTVEGPASSSDGGGKRAAPSTPALSPSEFFTMRVVRSSLKTQRAIARGPLS